MLDKDKLNSQPSKQTVRNVYSIMNAVQDMTKEEALLAVATFLVVGSDVYDAHVPDTISAGARVAKLEQTRGQIRALKVTLKQDMR